VSHCYRRPRRLPDWPYNLFAMLHGRTRAEVEQQAVQIAVPAGHSLPRPRHPVFHRHPQEDRPASAPHKGRKLNHVPHQPIHARARASRATGTYPVPAAAGAGQPPGPVVIWNLIRRCNLTCKHCYALSADHDYAGELSTTRCSR
jgi:hypothetical protein